MLPFTAIDYIMGVTKLASNYVMVYPQVPNLKSIALLPHFRLLRLSAQQTVE